MKKKEKFHPVVELYLKRTASHPEEVLDGKWKNAEQDILEFGNEAEKAAVNKVLRDAYLNAAHKEFMEELLVPEVPAAPLGGWGGVATTLTSAATGTGVTFPFTVKPTISAPKPGTKLQVDGDIEYTGRLKRVRKWFRK